MTATKSRSPAFVVARSVASVVLAGLAILVILPAALGAQAASAI
jgi:hypothetical protein